MAEGLHADLKSLASFTNCPQCGEKLVNPKLLPCLDTYCFACLQENRHLKDKNGSKRFVFFCKLCDHDVDLPLEVSGLPSNFLVNNILDFFEAQTNGLICANCGDRDSNNKNHHSREKQKIAIKAEAHCIDCGKSLCKNCLEAHDRMKFLTKDHQVLHFREMEPGQCRQLFHRPKLCPVHKEQRVKLYCKPCFQLICCECLMHHTASEGHETLLLDSKEVLEQVCETELKLENTKQAVPKFQASLKELIKTQSEIEFKAAKLSQQIKAVTESCIEALQKRQKSLLATLEEIVQRKMISLQQRETSLDCELANLCRVCSFLNTAFDLGDENEKLPIIETVKARLNELQQKAEHLAFGSQEFGYIEFKTKNLTAVLDHIENMGELCTSDMRSRPSIPQGYPHCPNVLVKTEENIESNSVQESQSLPIHDESLSSPSTVSGMPDDRVGSPVVTLTTKAKVCCIPTASSSESLTRSCQEGIGKLPACTSNSVSEDEKQLHGTSSVCQDLSCQLGIASEMCEPVVSSPTGSKTLSGSPPYLNDTNRNHISPLHDATVSVKNCKEIKNWKLVGQESTVTVVIKKGIDGMNTCSFPIFISAFLKEKDGKVDAAKVVKVSATEYEVRFRPTSEAVHQLIVTANGEHVTGSPFELKVKNDLKRKSELQMVKRGRRKKIKLAQRLEFSVESLGQKGNKTGCFDNPHSVAMDNSGNLVVSDCNNHRVQILRHDGHCMKCFGGNGVSGNKLHAPCGVAVDHNGHIFVCDSGSTKVKKFSENGELLTMFGTEGCKPGELKFPVGVAIHSDNSIIVSDYTNNCIHVFNPDGSLNFDFGIEGVKDGRFKSPCGVAVSAEGHIIVCDAGNNRVQVFDPRGNFLFKFGSEGSNCGEFRFPRGVAVNSRGHMIVSDSCNYRLQIFSPTGQFLNKIDGRFKLFHCPVGVAVNEDDVVFVCDWSGHKLEVIKFELPEMDSDTQKESVERQTEDEAAKPV